MRSAATRRSRAAPMFAALGDETRLAIVTRLSRGGALSIVRLTQGSRISRQAITKHLHALSRAGLVASARHGRERVWTLRPRRLAEARGYLAQISAQWDDALERLRSRVEEPS